MSRRAGGLRPGGLRPGGLRPGGLRAGTVAEEVGDIQDEEAGIRIHLDELLSRREMTLTDLSVRVGITIVNLSILKNGRARAIRFSTLARLCEALDCQPGELLTYGPAAGSDGAGQ